VVGLLLATPPAVLLGYAIAMHRFPGPPHRDLAGAGALSLPTVLIGLLLYLLLSRHGPLGGLQWLFSQPGIIAGQFVVALPVLLAFTLAAVQAARCALCRDRDRAGRLALAGDGTVLHEARFGVMAAVISGFGRVISEVGCALMVGGNIEGETRTITTAIALETSKGEFAQGIALGIVLVSPSRC
jgi:tungstate transport system permease protein